MKTCFARVRSRVDAIDGMYHLYIELLKEKRRVRELSTLLKTKFKLIQEPSLIMAPGLLQ